MSHRNLHRRPQARLLSWLLILAFGLLTVKPVHVHMLHDADSARVDGQHLAHVHSAAVVDDFEANLGDHTLEPASQQILKSFGFQVLLLALLVGVLSMPTRSALMIRRRSSATLPLNSLLRHRIPPLRAPPLV